MLPLAYENDRPRLLLGRSKRPGSVQPSSKRSKRVRENTWFPAVAALLDRETGEEPAGVHIGVLANLQQIAAMI